MKRNGHSCCVCMFVKWYCGGGGQSTRCSHIALALALAKTCICTMSPFLSITEKETRGERDNPLKEQQAANTQQVRKRRLASKSEWKRERNSRLNTHISKRRRDQLVSIAWHVNIYPGYKMLFTPKYPSASQSSCSSFIRLSHKQYPMIISWSRSGLFGSGVGGWVVRWLGG